MNEDAIWEYEDDQGRVHRGRLVFTSSAGTTYEARRYQNSCGGFTLTYAPSLIRSARVLDDYDAKSLACPHSLPAPVVEHALSEQPVAERPANVRTTIGRAARDDHWYTDSEFWLGLFFLWTIAGLIGEVFGLHIGWWRLLGFGLPANPRYN